MHHTLPSDACLEGIKKEARELLHAIRQGDAAAFGRFQCFDPVAALLDPKLSDALYVVAREYGYGSWERLNERLATTCSSRLTYPKYGSRSRKALILTGR